MIKNIIGQEGKYVICDSGDNDKTVFSIKYNSFVKPSTSCGGYLKVDFGDEQKHIHRLIAEAFIPNPNGYDTVHHKDHNPSNNKVENLEWIDSGNHIELHRKEKSKTVYQYTLDGELFKVWSSVGECARNGYNKGHVGACCRGEKKQHKGFKWSYKKI